MALPHFKFLVGPNSGFSVLEGQKIYVRPEIDTYEIDTYYFRDFIAIQDAPEGLVSNLESLHWRSLYPIQTLAMESDLFKRLILHSVCNTERKTLMKFRGLQTLVIAIELDDFGHEYNEDGTLIPGFRKKSSNHIELINTINPVIAAEDPSNPYRFETNRFIDSHLEQRFGCSSDERPWKLQGLLDDARETMRDM